MVSIRQEEDIKWDYKKKKRMRKKQCGDIKCNCLNKHRSKNDKMETEKNPVEYLTWAWAINLKILSNIKKKKEYK